MLLRKFEIWSHIAVKMLHKSEEKKFELTKALVRMIHKWQSLLENTRLIRSIFTFMDDLVIDVTKNI